MVVVAPTLRIGVRRRTVSVDAYGTQRAAGYGPLEPSRPARIVRVPAAVDSSLETGPGLWVLAIDPGFWPIAAGDLLVEDGGGRRVWSVMAAAHRPSDFGDVGYVRVEAVLREG